MTSLKKLTANAAYINRSRNTSDITLPTYGRMFKIVSRISLIFYEVRISLAILMILTLLITVAAVEKPPPISNKLSNIPKSEASTMNISKQFHLLLKYT